METRLKYAEKFAKGAADELMKRFRSSNLKIEKKGAIDLVTEADKKAEAFLIASIFASFPKDSILAEESGDIEKSNSEYRWIIDPLDGTTNFAHGFPLFAVSIGIERTVDGESEIVAGVIYVPYLGEMFTALKNGGAFLNGKPIKVNSETELINTVVATGFPYSKNHSEDNNLKEHNRIITKCRDIRRAGSAAIDLAYTALGIWGGYWEKDLKSWDIAAGALLVKEAGGVILNINKDTFSHLDGNIVAGNSSIVSEISRYL
jgi:myo-inositol-1(or 4)-monophosphatase